MDGMSDIPSASLEEASATLPAWRARVQSAQKSRRTPEAVAAAQERASARTRALKSVKRCERLEKVQAISKASFGGSMARYKSAPLGGEGFGKGLGKGRGKGSGGDVLGGGFGGPPVSAPAVLAAQAQQTSLAMSSLQRAASASDDEEADEAIEAACNQLVSAGHGWASRGAEGAREEACLLEDAFGGAGAGGGDGDGDTSDDLLSELKTEPVDDADAAARFRLYESHSETVATVRKSLFDFWGGAQADVPPSAVRSAIEASLRDIDAGENLELYINPSFWFVYSMARKTSSNEAKLEAVLREIRTKLELLASSEDCPVCLEPIGEDGTEAGTVLGCAHKLHANCWRHWSAHCHGRLITPFCPLCRGEEFLEEILVEG